MVVQHLLKIKGMLFLPLFAQKIDFAHIPFLVEN